MEIKYALPIVVLFISIVCIMISLHPGDEGEDEIALTNTYMDPENSPGGYVKLEPQLYKSEDNCGYLRQQSFTPEYGYLTNLNVYCKSYNNTGMWKGVPTYLDADYSFYVKIEVHTDYLNKNGNHFSLSYDDWTGTVDGVNNIGRVDLGALIIRTSTDNVHWSTTSGKPSSSGTNPNDPNGTVYEDGLFTSNFFNLNYPATYSPGHNVTNGLYIWVTIAYELESYGFLSRTVINVLEDYKIYAVMGNYDAVAIHNMSLYADDQDYDPTETMSDQSVTYTGFCVDRTLCPSATVDVSISTDSRGISYHKALGNKTSDCLEEFTEYGYYYIRITDVRDITKIVRIRVQSPMIEESITHYFGDSIIKGYRAYDEFSQYPIYSENSRIELILHESEPEMTGVITNHTSGLEYTISSIHYGHTAAYLPSGEYSATFTYHPISGDVWSFDLTFSVIPWSDFPPPKCNYEFLSKINDVRDYPGDLFGTILAKENGNRLIALFPTKYQANEFARSYLQKCVSPYHDVSGQAYMLRGEVFHGYGELCEYIDDIADRSVIEIDLPDGPLYTGSFNSFISSQMLQSAPDDIYVITDESVFGDIRVDKPIITKHESFVFSDGRWIQMNNDLVFHRISSISDSSQIYFKSDNTSGYLSYGISIYDQLKSMNCSFGEIKIVESHGYSSSHRSYTLIFKE